MRLGADRHLVWCVLLACRPSEAPIGPDRAVIAEPAPVTEVRPTAPGEAPTGATERATVTRVIDGDTIAIDRGRGEELVRYIGVDTPETVHPQRGVEWMGPEASAANAALVSGGVVLLEKDVSETDRYGRLLRHVWIEDASGLRNVGLALVEQGYAEAEVFPPDDRYATVYADVQRDARTRGLGRWGAPPPDEPLEEIAPAEPETVSQAADADGCHPSYRPCLPIVTDLNCPDVRGLGHAPVQVIGSDDYRLDRDGDGVGCE